MSKVGSEEDALRPIGETPTDNGLLAQCPTCGRIDHDFTKREENERDAQGHKAALNGDHSFKEDRAAAYRLWRYSLGNGAWVLDVDQVEWRRDDVGEPYPAATIELTRVDGSYPVPSGGRYLQKILDRFTERDFQAAHSRHVAHCLGVHCFIVAFRWDLSEFWVYNLSEPRGRWWHLTQQRYTEWLRGL